MSTQPPRIPSGIVQPPLRAPHTDGPAEATRDAAPAPATGVAPRLHTLRAELEAFSSVTGSDELERRKAAAAQALDAAVGFEAKAQPRDFKKQLQGVEQQLLQIRYLRDIERLEAQVADPSVHSTDEGRERAKQSLSFARLELQRVEKKNKSVDAIPHCDRLIEQANSELHGYDRATLAAMLGYRQALLKQRFDGPWNVVPRLFSKVHSAGAREQAEVHIKNAEQLLAEHPEERIAPEIAFRIVDSLEVAYKKESAAQVEVREKNKIKEMGIRRFDAFLDDLTEYVFSNAICILATAGLVRTNDALVAGGGKRMDADGNWPGHIREFLYRSLPYFLGVAVSRGKNFLTEIDETTHLPKLNLGFAIAELEGTAMMTAGSQAAIRGFEGFFGRGSKTAALLGAAIAGAWAGGYCYWRAAMLNPLSSNTDPLKAAARAALNVAARMGLLPVVEDVVSTNPDARSRGPARGH